MKFAPNVFRMSVGGVTLKLGRADGHVASGLKEVIQVPLKHIRISLCVLNVTLKQPEQ